MDVDDINDTDDADDDDNVVDDDDVDNVNDADNNHPTFRATLRRKHEEVCSEEGAYLVSSKKVRREVECPIDELRALIMEAEEQDSFFPPRDYLQFIGQIDELLQLEKTMAAAGAAVRRQVDNILKTYNVSWTNRRDSMRWESKYKRTREAYFELRRQLQKPDAKLDPLFEPRVASLEVVGAILVNPRILYQTWWGDREDFPSLWTWGFATRWTQDRIERIKWTGDEGLTFCWTNKTEFHIHLKPP